MAGPVGRTPALLVNGASAPLSGNAPTFAVVLPGDTGEPLAVAGSAPTFHPPLAAGVFYCLLDWLVGLRSRAGAPWAARVPATQPA